MQRLGSIVLCSALGLVLVAAPALAGPRYHAHYLNHPPAPAYGDDRPVYDGAPTQAGFVFQRHDPRCEYPRGWSVTDFTRNINGIPRSGFDLIETGCAASEPFQ